MDKHTPPCAGHVKVNIALTADETNIVTLAMNALSFIVRRPDSALMASLETIAAEEDYQTWNRGDFLASVQAIESLFEAAREKVVRMNAMLAEIQQEANREH